MRSAPPALAPALAAEYFSEVDTRFDSNLVEDFEDAFRRHARAWSEDAHHTGQARLAVVGPTSRTHCLHVIWRPLGLLLHSRCPVYHIFFKIDRGQLIWCLGTSAHQNLPCNRPRAQHRHARLHRPLPTKRHLRPPWHLAARRQAHVCAAQRKHSGSRSVIRTPTDVFPTCERPDCTAEARHCHCHTPPAHRTAVPRVFCACFCLSC